MDVVITQLITLALSNFTVTCLILGFLVSALVLFRRQQLTWQAAVEVLFAYFLFFSIGVANVYNFVMHVFFGSFTAQFIGWAPSPFQAEVGFASLGFAALGFLAFRGSFGLRLAAVVAPACFLLGAAAGHVYQMLSAGNFSPGNAGAIFYTDILVPILGFVFLVLQRRAARLPSYVRSRSEEAQPLETAQ
jgi:hypothetical protein